MKKYRFGDPSTQGPFRKYSFLITFVLAWNMGGYALYKWQYKKAADKDPEFEMKTQSEYTSD